MARFPGYAPQYGVRIDGEEIPPLMRGSVSRVELTTSLKGADRVEMSLANMDYRLTDHPLLEIERTYELSFGYAPDPLEIVFSGEITGIEPTYPLKGIPTIRVAAQDRMNRLTRNRKDTGFQVNIPSVGNLPLPDTTVIQNALSSLKPEIDPVGGALSVLTTLATYLLAPQVGQEGVRIQESQSDFEFLTRLANENGWEMYIDHAAAPAGFVLRFRSLVEDFSPVLSLEAGASILDFTPRLTSVGDVAGVSARIWVDFLKSEFVIVLGWDFEQAAFDIKILPDSEAPISDILGGAEAATIDLKPASFATAVQQLFRELLPRLNNRHTGSVSAVGDPRLRPGEVIAVEGVGRQFGGLYRVTSATHTFDQSGYQTRCDVRKEAWFNDAGLPKGAQGLARALGQTTA